jgi:hypothetical protein
MLEILPGKKKRKSALYTIKTNLRLSSDNTNLSKIIIEGFAFGQGARILERKELLESEEIIASFNNRRPGVPRSRK